MAERSDHEPLSVGYLAPITSAMPNSSATRVRGTKNSKSFCAPMTSPRALTYTSAQLRDRSRRLKSSSCLSQRPWARLCRHSYVGNKGLSSGSTSLATIRLTVAKPSIRSAIWVCSKFRDFGPWSMRKYFELAASPSEIVIFSAFRSLPAPFRSL